MNLLVKVLDGTINNIPGDKLVSDYPLKDGTYYLHNIELQEDKIIVTDKSRIFRVHIIKEEIRDVVWAKINDPNVTVAEFAKYLNLMQT